MLTGKGENVFRVCLPVPHSLPMEPKMNHPDLNMATVTARLMAMRDALREESADSRDARETVMLDQSSVGRLSRMDALQGQAMAKAEEERRQLTLTRIASALARIERGEYGACIACGEWIAARRLEGDPVVLKCIDCAE
ncbi:TraR/DksA family transcriptional regulator [Halomonas sp. M4R1S46]|uniref:TraR/DksA family transcriptional regulator n=1 Tax=Halomonas sp. M4R1S46 TaxID=2982692 RepID=UPI0021E3720E|nr:TraR/DksA family transcriptional regulator [Halomonas sp. M4R1S46]UYG06910.1 TraR/DksA family transcriptional regulator [Halomonas sp. M4R1S46]